MLRCRVVNSLPLTVAVGVPFSLQIRLTNESGSNMHTSVPVQLRISLVHGHTLAPVEPSTAVVAVGAHSSSKIPTRAGGTITDCYAMTDVLGRCDVDVAIQLGKAKRAATFAGGAGLRLTVTAVAQEPVFISPSASPSFWPVVLLPSGMSVAGLACKQPRAASAAVDAASSAADKKAEKRRRSEAFAAAGGAHWADAPGGSDEGAGDGMSDDSRDTERAGKVLIEQATAHSNVPGEVGEVKVIPVTTSAFVLHDSEGGGSGAVVTGSEAGEGLRQLQVVPTCGLRVSIFERQSVIGPGFGSVVWDCAVVLTEYLHHHAAELALRSADSVILELGTGTGFVGITLAAALGLHVFASDLDIMLPLASDNVRLNGEVIARRGGSVSVEQHAWGDDVGPLLHRGFTHVIASEVVYDMALFEPLANTLSALTQCDPAPVIILAGRKRAGCELASFLALLLRRGFDVSPLPLYGGDSGCGAEDVKVADFAKGCTGLSKTRYAPMIFRIVRRRVVDSEAT